VKNIHANLYVIKGKPLDIITSTGNRKDSEKLVKYEPQLEVLISKLVSKKVKTANKVYFVIWEGDYSEKNNLLENETSFEIYPIEHSLSEFNKTIRLQEKEDKKALTN